MAENAGGNAERRLMVFPLFSVSRLRFIPERREVWKSKKGIKTRAERRSYRPSMKLPSTWRDGISGEPSACWQLYRRSLT